MTDIRCFWNLFGCVALSFSSSSSSTMCNIKASHFRELVELSTSTCASWDLHSLSERPEQSTPSTRQPLETFGCSVCMCMWETVGRAFCINIWRYCFIRLLFILVCFLTWLTLIWVAALVFKCCYAQRVSQRNSVKHDAYPFGMDKTFVVLQWRILSQLKNKPVQMCNPRANIIKTLRRKKWMSCVCNVHNEMPFCFSPRHTGCKLYSKTLDSWRTRKHNGKAWKQNDSDD